jgi:hypothetical protein
MSQLSSYPNVFNTCLVLLRRDGFKLSHERSSDMWVAERNGFSFRADNPIELLGLAAIYEKLQPKEDREYWWQISDPNIISEIDP